MSFILLGILNAQAAGAVGAGAYDLLETQVLASNASSVEFTGLGSYSDYKHLQLRWVAKPTSGAENMELRFNSDTGTNYSWHLLFGSGSSVSSASVTTVDHIGAGQLDGGAPTEAFASAVIDILDFSSTTKNTTIRYLNGRQVTDQSRITLGSGAWRDTSAVTTISLNASGAKDLVTGSRFSLYGVK
jgi:hypothetical protein